MLRISSGISLPDDEIELLSIRAQGSGGQNVNKLSSAIHLRFDVRGSSLPECYKEGVIVIKAQQYRTQEKTGMMRCAVYNN